jgi:hypothetical protein
LPSFILKNQRDIIQLGIILLAALIIRLWAIPHIPSAVNLDNSTYQIAALDLMAEGIITNPYIMPLYPLFLAVLGGGEKARVLTGMTFGLISIVLVWAFARALFDDKKVGLVAAGMMAIYPMAIFYSVQGLTESLFVPLILGAFLALHKNRPYMASVLFAISILARPTMEPYAPFAIFGHALVIHKKGVLLAFRDLIVYGIFYALIMSPWWYHNLKKYDYFVRLNHSFGLVFYAGNNSKNVSGGGIGGKDYSVWDVFNKGANPAWTSPKNYENLLKDAAVKYILQNPSNFLKMAGVKFVRFWRLVPHTPLVTGNTAAKITTISVLPVILLACLTLITKREKFMHLIPALGFIVFLTLVHMVTIGSIRYRYPLEPLLIVIAAPSLLLIWEIFIKEAFADGKPPDIK